MSAITQHRLVSCLCPHVPCLQWDNIFLLGFYRLGVPDISITLKRIHRISSSATYIHMYTPLPDYLMLSGKAAKGKKI